MSKRNLIIGLLILLFIICFTCTYYILSKLASVYDITTDPNYINVEYNQVEDIGNEDVLGILEIEKIQLKATVKDGTSNQILKDYIGHIESTSFYERQYWYCST